MFRHPDWCCVLTGKRFPASGLYPSGSQTQIETKNPRANLLVSKWQQVWLLALERRRKLNDALDRLEEVRKSDPHLPVVSFVCAVPHESRAFFPISKVLRSEWYFSSEMNTQIVCFYKSHPWDLDPENQKRRNVNFKNQMLISEQGLELGRAAAGSA